MLLVLTPLKFEGDALAVALGSPTGEENVEGVKIRHFGQIALATGGHGKVQFALTSQLLIRALKPELAICAGACGALVPELKPMDVVAGLETIEHDFHLHFIQRPQPLFHGDPTYIKKLRALKPESFGLHFGRIASGDEDIIETTRAQSLRARTQAIAVAWEGAGGARAAAFCKTPFLELRLVTDTADEHAPYDFQNNVRSGMVNVARLLMEMGN